MIAFANNWSKKFFNRYDSFEEYLYRAQKKCEELKNSTSLELEAEDHLYSVETAKEELGLDDELIESLLEDYVTQIIHTLPQFRSIIKHIRKELKKGKKADLTPLRDLAHKNLGVARNLRIKDAQKILYAIMKNDDLDFVEECLEYLEACAVLLRPQVAYEVYTS